MGYRGSCTPLYRHKYVLQQSLNMLHTRMKTLNPLGITHDEFLSLLAPREHWDILKSASEVAEVSASSGDITVAFSHPLLAGNGCTLRMVISNADNDAPLRPRNRVVLSSAPAALQEKLAHWANQETSVAMQFARASHLVDWLDASCESRGQVRFIWPTLLSLCSLNESTAQLGEKLREFKTPRSLPAIPLEVRNACKESSGVITGAMLMGDEQPTFNAPVVVGLASSQLNEHAGALGLIAI